MLKKLISWLTRSQIKENVIMPNKQVDEPRILINHRRYKRNGIRKGEKSDIALSYAVSSKPEERYLLVELIDKYDFALYFQSSREECIDNCEKEALILEIAKDVKPGKSLVLHEVTDLDLFLNLGFRKICIDEFPVIMKDYDY